MEQTVKEGAGRMKKKIEFPDWTGPACMMITGGGKDGDRKSVV